MLKFLLALHLLFAVFAIGPLVHAATTAGRGIRRGDGTATAASARVLRIYAYASVLVIIVGFGLMSQKRPDVAGVQGYVPLDQISSSSSSAYASTLKVSSSSTHVADFGDTWIWLSLVLWAVAIAIVLAVIVPTLNRATKHIAAEDSVVALTARVAAAGGVVGLIFAGIVFLMVYKPGS